MKTKRFLAVLLTVLLVLSTGVFALGAAADEPAPGDPSATGPDLTDTSGVAEALVKRLLVSESDYVPDSAKLTLANEKQTATFDDEAIFWAGEKFDGSDAIKLPAGIILSTGDATQALRKHQEAQGGYKSLAYQDEDLGNITENTPQYDTVALEFDVHTNGNVMMFEYVFASNEFDQLKKFKDTFGLFVNGRNVALINGIDNKTMTIDNLKDGQAETVMQSNEYYKVVDHFDTCGFDGVTRVQRVQAPVEKDSVAHIKLVIADFDDSVFDSAVFIKAKSLETQSSVQGSLTHRVNNGQTTMDRLVVKAGDRVNYAITIANKSHIEAKDVVVTDYVPEDLILEDADGVENYIQNDGAWDAEKRTITWTLGDMKVNETKTVTFSAEVPETDDEAIWINKAIIKSSNGAEYQTNEAILVKDGVPNVSLSKAQSINGGLATTEDREIGPNDTVTYYLTVFNNGKGAARNLIIKDTVPEGLELVYDSISDGGESTPDGIVWKIGTVQPGELYTVSFDCTTPSTRVPQFWGNTASAEFNTSNSPLETIKIYSNTVEADKDGAAALTMAVQQKVNDMMYSIADTDVMAGQVLTYKVNVVNTGLGTANYIEVTDVIPEGLTVVENSISDGGLLLRGNIVWTFERLGAGESKTLTFKCTVPDTTDKAEYKNFAYATYGHVEIDGKASSQSNTVKAVKDGMPVLAVNGTASVNGAGATIDAVNVQAGDKIVYTFTVNNIGKGVAKNVTLTDLVPEGMKYVSGTATEGCTEQSNRLSWSWDKLDIGQSVTVSFTVEIPTTSEATSWENTATATFSHTNTGMAGTQSSNTLTLRKDGVSNLVLEMKQSAGNDLTNETLAVREGSSIKYSVVLMNDGTGDAKDVVLYSMIPAGATLNTQSLASGADYLTRAADGDEPSFTGAMRLFGIEGDGSGQFDGVVTWKVPTLKAGQTVTKEFTVTLPVGSGVKNWRSESVATYGTSNNPEDIIARSNKVIAGETIESVLTGTMSQGLTSEGVGTEDIEVVKNDTIHYSVLVKNASDAPVSDIKVTVPVPAGLTVKPESVSNDGTLEGEIITWKIKSLDGSDSRTLTFECTVPDAQAGNVYKTSATIAASNLDDVTTNAVKATVKSDTTSQKPDGNGNGTGTTTDNTKKPNGSGSNTTGTGNNSEYKPSKEQKVKPSTGVEEDSFNWIVLAAGILSIGAVAAVVLMNEKVREKLGKKLFRKN